MTTVALLGLDLVLCLVGVGLWGYAAVRARRSALLWAAAALLVVLARLVTVVSLAGRGWELAAERVTVGVPLALLVGLAALTLLVRDRRRDRSVSKPARVLLWGRRG